MDGDPDRTDLRADHLAPLSGHANLRPHDALRRRRSEDDDQLRPHAGDLGVQPRAAGPHLVRGGRLVDPALAAWVPLEVLHHVRDVDQAPVDAGLGEGAVEQFAGRPNERYPRQILLVPGLLADEHQLGAARPCAEYRLGRVTPQIAGPAAGGRGTQGAQGGAWRRGGYGLHEGHVGPDADTVPSVPSEV